MKTNHLLGLIVLIIIAVAVGYALPRTAQSPQTISAIVHNYDECVKAGYGIQKSLPPTCRTPNGTVYTSTTSNPEVVIDSPQIGDVVKSPLKVTGKAKGNWFFEANIPVTLKDENGKVLSQVGMHAIDDWMTTDFVRFEGTMTFTTPTTTYGVLIINNDNPSGMPELEKSFVVPIRFK